jgi:hypothetical protein
MIDMGYDKLSKAIYAQNKAVGWWDDPNRCLFETLQLVSTEVAEATEAERKGLFDDHLPHRMGGEVELADAMIRVLDLGGRLGLTYVPRAVDSLKYGDLSVGARHLTINREIIRLADSLLPDSMEWTTQRSRHYSRLLNKIAAVADSFGYDLPGALLEKLEYNRHRADHKRENRAKANGKRF